MAFGAAMSEHPITAHAVGEVTGAVLEQVGERPDVALVFVTPPHAGALEDAMRTVAEVLHPLASVGCAAESVVGPHREVEGTAAVVLFAGHTGPLAGVALDTAPGPDGDAAVHGWPERLPFEPRGVVLLADPYSFDVDGFLAWLAGRHPGLPVTGGMVSGARGPGGNRLALGADLRTRGALAVLLGPGAVPSTVVSQGCRPFGQPVVVTGARQSLIDELAGRPAVDLLRAQVQGTLDAEEVALLQRGGLHLGLVIDEHRETFGRGDFLVRNVLGVERGTGALALGDAVSVGTTVQFHLRDAASADEDLRALLAPCTADAALLFTCNGRGTRLFGAPHHDVGVLADTLGHVPVAGCFCAGEIGPVGGRNFLHGFTASVALLHDASAGAAPARGAGDPEPGSAGER